jgi:hypothetical protein
MRRKEEAEEEAENEAAAAVAVAGRWPSKKVKVIDKGCKEIRIK